MHYTSIVLGLLEQRPVLYEKLRTTQRLLPTMEALAKELKTAHEIWKQELASTVRPSDSTQIASEALELALKELEKGLPPLQDGEAFSLDQAMAFIKSRTSPV